MPSADMIAATGQICDLPQKDPICKIRIFSSVTLFIKHIISKITLTITCCKYFFTGFIFMFQYDYLTFIIIFFYIQAAHKSCRACSYNYYVRMLQLCASIISLSNSQVKHISFPHFRQNILPLTVLFLIHLEN